MNKTTYATVLLLLTCFSINAQINTHNLSYKQKANHYLTTKGELYFTFKVNDHKDIDQYSKEFTVLDYDPYTKTVEAWANKKEFESFLMHNITYEVSSDENDPSERLMTNSTEYMNKSFNNNIAAGTNAYTLTFPLTAYPTYADYAQQMQDFEDTYPNLVQKFSIGFTGEGDKKLLFVKLSDNVSVDEQEPRFLYTSSMHGDEIAGYPMMLDLIDYFLTAYSDTEHIDHARIKNLLDNSEVSDQSQCKSGRHLL